MTEPEYLFVYGTLKRNHHGELHPLLQGLAMYIGPASLPGSLYRVADYPGAIYSTAYPQQSVYGELYRLLSPVKLLAILDEYEECSKNFAVPHEYLRRKLPVSSVDNRKIQAWIYLYNRPVTYLDEIIDGDF